MNIIDSLKVMNKERFEECTIKFKNIYDILNKNSGG